MCLLLLVHPHICFLPRAGFDGLSLIHLVDQDAKRLPKESRSELQAQALHLSHQIQQLFSSDSLQLSSPGLEAVVRRTPPGVAPAAEEGLLAHATNERTSPQLPGSQLRENRTTDEDAQICAWQIDQNIMREDGAETWSKSDRTLVAAVTEDACELSRENSMERFDAPAGHAVESPAGYSSSAALLETYTALLQE